MKKILLFKQLFIYSFLFLFMIAIASLNVSVNATTKEEDMVEHIEDEDLYVSDGYFKQSSTIYNPHLASLSMVFANSTGPAGDPKGAHDFNWFKSQTGRISGFLTKIHFEDFDSNDDYKKPTAFDTIGVGAAKKEIGDDYTVVAVGIRSSGYRFEWANNMWLGDGTKSDYMHEGWYNAANKTISFIQSYVDNHVTTSKIKLWITGFSRGGATANITAGLLDNKIKNSDKLFNNATLSHDDLFAYTFEAPQGANYNSTNIEKPKSNLYNNIWNIINPNDIVPKVAMSQYGFTRFGTDKYITDYFYDSTNYVANRDVYKKLLAKLTTETMNPDDFRMYGLPIDFLGKGAASKIMTDNFTILQPDHTKGGYTANIAEMLLLEELTSNIGSRSDYVRKLQSGLKDVLLLLMDYNYQFDKSTIFASLPGALAEFVLGGIIYGITGSYNYIDGAFDAFKRVIPNETISTAIKLIIPLLGPLVSTYWNRPNELISCAKYIKEIFQNHNTEVTLAHVRAQDSYYIDAYNEKCSSDSEKISLVPFLENIDYGRMSFLGFNDAKLYLNGNKKVDIEGFTFGKSEIRLASPGFAAGYYSYATEERLEVFFPLNHGYKIEMKDYSKKPYHTFNYWAYVQYFSVGPNGQTKRQVDYFEDWTCFNSKRYPRNVNVA